VGIPEIIPVKVSNFIPVGSGGDIEYFETYPLTLGVSETTGTLIRPAIEFFE
jgi:hypothetical protein